MNKDYYKTLLQICAFNLTIHSWKTHLNLRLLAIFDVETRVLLLMLVDMSVYNGSVCAAFTCVLRCRIYCNSVFLNKPFSHEVTINLIGK